MLFPNKKSLARCFKKYLKSFENLNENGNFM